MEYYEGFFFENQGPTASIMGSKDATRHAFKRGLIENGDCWMEMIDSRNLTSHTYHQEIAHDIAKRIVEDYFDLFKLLEARLKGL